MFDNNNKTRHSMALAALLAEGLVRGGFVRDFLLPAPTQVARALGEHREELARMWGVPELPAKPGKYTWHVLADNGYHAPARRSGAIDVGLPVVPLD